jgi:hypothetical protein
MRSIRSVDDKINFFRLLRSVQAFLAIANVSRLLTLDAGFLRILARFCIFDQGNLLCYGSRHYRLSNIY